MKIIRVKEFIITRSRTVWMHKSGGIILRYEQQYHHGWYDIVHGNGLDIHPESFFREHCVFIGRFD